MVIERYSHVMHIVSNVEGHAEARARRASTCCARRFPAGTVSGAPKVRAMEIIDELEPVEARRLRRRGRLPRLPRRHGPRDRDPHRGGEGRLLYAQAAAGIVADSIAESEWQETQNKARALLRAAEMATPVWTRGSNELRTRPGRRKADPASQPQPTAAQR